MLNEEEDIFKAICGETVPATAKQLKFIRSLCSQLDLEYDDYVPEHKLHAGDIIEDLIQMKEEAEEDDCCKIKLRNDDLIYDEDHTEDCDVY